MQIEINRSTLSLAPEGLVAIRDGQGTRILCNTGSLWITQECDVKDAVITAGESFTVRNRGLTLLTALSAAEVTVIEPHAGIQTQPLGNAWNGQKLRDPGVFA